MTLREQLQGAKIVVVDPLAELTLAWFGGHGVHAYDDAGREVAFWNTGDFAKNDANPRTVRASMNDRMRNQDYNDFS